MRTPRKYLVIGGFLVLLVFSSSVWAGTMPRAKAPSPGNFLTRVWEAVVSLWSKTGCGADPNGAASQAGTGCGMDPNGRCLPSPSSVAADTGCTADPDGRRCGS